MSAPQQVVTPAQLFDVLRSPASAFVTIDGGYTAG
jgi:hypothetical protein